MKCNYPLNLTSPEGSVYTVPCGRCIACRVNRTTEWTTRILHESRCHNVSSFVTLTYRESHIPGKGSLSKIDLQKFFKRLRRVVPRTIRYFACGEYGENYQRPHYHAIIFGLSCADRQLIEYAWSVPCFVKRCKLKAQMKRMYKKEGVEPPIMMCRNTIGFVHIGNLTEASARYSAKYLQKQLFGAKGVLYAEKRIEKEFLLTSRVPGIGAKFAEKFIETWLENGFVVINGIKRPIPRFYLTKIPEKRLAEYRQRLNIFGYINLHREAGEQQKTIYEVMDREVSERGQREKNIEAKASMNSKSKL